MKIIQDALISALNDIKAIDENNSHGKTIDLLLSAIDVVNIRDILRLEYLDFKNNYLSPSLFGEHRGLTEDQAHQLIRLGRDLFNSKHPEE